jgi:hypothetical protein
MTCCAVSRRWKWGELSGRSIPLRAVTAVVDHLLEAFPDGVVRLQRQGFARCLTTRWQTGDGEWVRLPTLRFPLLDAASAIGKPCAASTRQWSVTRHRLLHLDAGRIVA